MRHTTPAWIWLAACVLAACSIDPDANPFHRDDCEPGEVKVGEFCVPAADGGNGTADAGGKDAATDASAQRDAARDAASDAQSSADAGDAGGNLSDPCDEEGARELCYTGPAGTELQQPCRAGSRSCEGGQWGTCKSQVLPKDEVCNGSDDDCDGQPDDGIAPAACDTGKLGACKPGVEICQSGAPKCLQVTFPEQETCDGEDRDCDGKDDPDDEELFQYCYTAGSGCTANGGNYDCVGVCRAGVLRCLAGVQETSCAGKEVTPGTEVLDSDPSHVALDEDCDGSIDENLCVPSTTRACYSGPAGTNGVGECHGDTITCDNTMKYDTCNEITPVPESCANDGVGKDDDCNGTPNDIIGRGSVCANPDSNAKGDCAQGTKQCVGASLDCVVPAMLGTESACDGHDEDCDGKTDELWNLQTDANNCGTCGNKCPSNAPSCCAGSCVNTTISNSHCGSCGSACSASKTCCASGCRDLKADEGYCGSCNIACGLLQTCSSGVCKIL